jgi:8-oxo-dGTP pyrophosphatase MutT (NUDIX family)
MLKKVWHFVLIGAGETISDCAVREVLEETGISLLHQQQHQQQQQPSTATAAATAAATDSPAPPSSSTGDTAGSPAAANTPSSSSTSSSGPACEREVPRNLCRQPLHHPTAFAAVDSVIRDAQDQIKYHYAIIEVGTAAWVFSVLPGRGSVCLS